MGKPIPIEDRIQTELATVTTYRDEARRQLDAFENQLLVLNRLLNPPPPPESEPDPPSNATPEGTI